MCNNLTMYDINKWSSVASIVTTIATIIALSVGGWFALFKIRIFRELKPHMTVSQDVTYRHIGSQYIHIMGKASIHNSSKVAVQIDQAFIRVQAVAPISDNEVEVLFAEALTQEESGAENGAIWWPTLDEIDRSWGSGELIIEPGGTDTQAYEFIIDKEVEAVLVYAYFRNADHKEKTGVPQGWEVSAVYDLHRK